MSTKLEGILAATAPAVMSPHVSPGLHPDSILPHGPILAADDSPATAEAFSNARLGLKALYASMHDIEVADIETRKQHGSGVVVDGASIRPAISPERAAELAASMGQRWDATARVFDQHMKAVNQAREALEATIKKALESPKRNEASVSQAASDIRHYVKDLPNDKRLNFLHEAIDNGDHEVVAAVLGTSGFVSGLNREQFATVKDLATKKFAPRQHEQHAALSAVADTMTLAAKNWSARFDQLLPHLKESPHEAALKALKGA